MTTLYLTAPASPLNQNETEAVIHILQDWGMTVLTAPHLGLSDRFVAGSDQVRAQDLMEGFLNPDVDAVVALKGGYGSGRLLDLLDYDLLARQKKPFFGFSDLTALQLALWTRAGLPSFSGFNANFVLKDKWAMVQKSFLAALKGQACRLKGDLAVALPHTPKICSGLLIGGTLSLITQLIGTPYCPDFRGTILIIEDVGEQPYRIDRMLTQLRLAGVFDAIQALIIGHFDACVSKDTSDGTLQDVWYEWGQRLSCPVIMNVPYGHNIDHLVVPIGARVHVDVAQAVVTIQNPFFGEAHER